MFFGKFIICAAAFAIQKMVLAAKYMIFFSLVHSAYDIRLLHRVYFSHHTISTYILFSSVCSCQHFLCNNHYPVYSLTLRSTNPISRSLRTIQNDKYLFIVNSTISCEHNLALSKLLCSLWPAQSLCVHFIVEHLQDVPFPIRHGHRPFNSICWYLSNLVVHERWAYSAQNGLGFIVLRPTETKYVIWFVKDMVLYPSKTHFAKALGVECEK